MTFPKSNTKTFTLGQYLNENVIKLTYLMKNETIIVSLETAINKICL